MVDNVIDKHACKNICLDEMSCKYFAYNWRNNTCHLQTIEEPNPGHDIVSGTRNCLLYLHDGKTDKSWTENYCFKLHAENVFPIQTFEGLANGNECGQKCKESEDCLLFTYHKPSHPTKSGQCDLAIEKVDNVRNILDNE